MLLTRSRYIPTVTLSSCFSRSESVAPTGEEQEPDEVESVQINLRRGAERYGSGRARNIRYGAIHANDYSCLPGASPTAVPPVYDRRPGRFVRHIDFNHFRTIGMRRSVEESVSSRFVTAERLEIILKVSPDPRIQ